MNLEKAEALAKSLMMRHGVGHLPFEFSRTRRTIAACAYAGFKHDRRTWMPTKIMLSSHWAKVMDENDIREIILHEIAHALTLTTDGGHGYRFKAQVRAMGGKATDHCYKPQAEIEYPWVGVCPKGHESKHYRAPGRLKACGKCSPRFSTDNLYTWYKNGRKVDHFDVSKGMRADVVRLSAQGKM